MHIGGEFKGEVIEQNGEYYLKGDILYQLFDIFADPFDTPNWTDGSYDPFKPYEIQGFWTEPIYHAITKEQFENFK